MVTGKLLPLLPLLPAEKCVQTNFDNFRKMSQWASRMQPPHPHQGNNGDRKRWSWSRVLRPSFLMLRMVFPTKAIFTSCSPQALPCSPPFLILPFPLVFFLFYVVHVSLLLNPSPSFFWPVTLPGSHSFSFFSPSLYWISRSYRSILFSTCWNLASIPLLCCTCPGKVSREFVLPTLPTLPVLSWSSSSAPTPHVAVWSSGWCPRQGPPLAVSLPRP